MARKCNQPLYAVSMWLVGSHEKNTSYRELIHNDRCTLHAKLRSLGPSFPCLPGRDDDNFGKMIRRWITLDVDTGRSLYRPIEEWVQLIFLVRFIAVSRSCCIAQQFYILGMVLLRITTIGKYVSIPLCQQMCLEPGRGTPLRPAGTSTPAGSTPHSGTALG